MRFNAKHTNALGETKTLEVIGWIRGTHTNSNHLMAIVRDKTLLYEIRADKLEFDSWSPTIKPGFVLDKK